MKQERLTSLYWAFTVLFTVKYALRRARDNDPWTVGDWLINYQAGFVRRGLPGQVILALGRLIHVHLNVIVLALTLSLYAVFVWTTYRITREVQWNVWLLALFLSPATLAFPLLSPGIGVRKEMLLFAGLGCLLTSKVVYRASNTILTGSLAVYVAILILSHEALLMFLPYVFAALVLKTGAKRAIHLSVLPALVAIASAFVVVQHPGNMKIAMTVCSSVGGVLRSFDSGDKGICGGGISWLQESAANAHAYVLAHMWTYHYLATYAFLATLSFAPALIAGWIRYQESHKRRTLQIVTGSVLLSLVGSSVLFYNAIDWGRWIHIHVVCLMLLLLSEAKRAGSPCLEKNSSRARMTLTAALLVVFSTCWILPTTITSNVRPKLGYFGVFRMLYGHPRVQGRS